MKTIERLKQLLALASRGKWYERGINIHIDTTNDGKPYEGFIGAIAYDGHRDLVIESRNALPALLAVVEAAMEVKRVFYVGTEGELRFISLESATASVCRMEDALRALEGGE